MQRVRIPLGRPHLVFERLRDALTQRATEWRVTLRSEPKVARLFGQAPGFRRRVEQT